MYVEAPRRARQPALRRARFPGHAERLDFSGPLHIDLAGHGSDVRLDFHLGGDRTLGASGRVRGRESQICAFLLRAVSGGGLPGGGVRLSSGKTRAVESLVVALPAAILLSPGDVLCDGPVSLNPIKGVVVGWGKLERKATVESGRVLGRTSRGPA